MPAVATWTHKHLLGLEELTRVEIEAALALAREYQPISTSSAMCSDALRGRVVVNIFFEESTRTRVSFELAARRLGAEIIEFSERDSSTRKGESLIDTARTVLAMGVDTLVLRHPASGAAHHLAKLLPCSIVNAGDGSHEHPTQGLLDLLTISEAKGRIDGLNIAIVGDVAHSRVARSTSIGLRKLGANVTFVGPPTLVSKTFESLGVRVVHQLDDILPQMDAVMMLRIQRERITSNVFPSVREYIRYYALDRARLNRCKPDVLIMHPGPMNRGVEISPEVADSDPSRILRQVTNGVAVRMAVLTLCRQASAGFPRIAS